MVHVEFMRQLYHQTQFTRSRDGLQLRNVIGGLVAGTRIAAWPFFAWPCLVDAQRAAEEVLPVERFDGRFAFPLATHFHKRESARTAGFPIHDNVHGGYRAVRFKRLA